MSRRKQGKPQQRKTFDSLEDEFDLIVCGDCQTNFPLHDIVKFIQHKIHKCNKENVGLVGGKPEEGGNGGGDTDEEMSVIGSRTPSISAPITRKESVEVTPRSDSKPTTPRLLEPMRERNSQLDNCIDGQHGTGRDEEDDVKKERKPPEPDKLLYMPPLKPVHVDAESNTTNSEPSKFLCVTCKQKFNSAWFLLQHAQSVHGMKIYIQPVEPQNAPVLSREPTPRPAHPPQSPATSTPPRICSNPGSSPHTPHNPFMFQLPPSIHDVVRPPCSSVNHFNRPPGPSMRFDLVMPNDPFHSHRIAHMPGAFDHPSPQHPYHNALFERQRSIALGMGLDDFYSQRLRQMVTQSATPSPVKKPPGSFSPSVSPFSNIRPSSGSSPPEDVQKRDMDRDRDTMSPGKMNLKSCEFCGKCFRFQSNLIVHRRSHTGEKPFKCHLCPHACTQASKLKRHMKTHNNKSPLSSTSQASNLSNASEGSEPESCGGSPDSNKMRQSRGNFADDIENEEARELEDEEEELEDEEEEMEGMEDGIEGLEMERGSNAGSPISDDSSSRRRHMEHCRAALNYSPISTGPISNHHGKPMDFSNLSNKPSLLRDVMSNTGLGAIQQYSEAFKQALEENSLKEDKKSPELELTENGVKEEAPERRHRNSSEESRGSPSHHLSHRQRHYENHEDDLHSKQMVKQEPPENLHSSVEQFYAATSMWYPSAVPHQPRHFYLGHPQLPLHGQERNHNAYLNKPPPPPESALKSIMPGCGLATPGTSNSAQNGGTPIRRNDRRNDTCEFCGKIFKNCSNLTVHRRSHTGEKPYKCELCNYACAQSSKLTRHMKTHGRLGKDVYRCKFCSMPFSVASTLEKHMRKCVENQTGIRSIGDPDTDTNSTTASNL